MTVCWVQHAGEWPFYLQLAKKLKEYGCDSIFVSKTRDTHEAYLGAGAKSLYVGDAFVGPDLFSNEQLASFDRTYGPPGIRAIAGSDVQLTGLIDDDDRKYQAIARTYEFWERFLKEYKVDAFLVRETATFISRTAYTVAHKNGIPLMQIAPGPADELFTLDEVSENHIWSELLQELGRGSRGLTSEELERVDTFIEKRIASVPSKMRLRFVPTSLMDSAKRIVGLMARDTKENRRHDPVKIAAFRWRIRREFGKLEWKYMTRLFFKHDEPQEGERYVYFPMYSGHETPYLCNDHFFALNQIPLISEVAHSLPVGVFLYVKEHPVNPGYLSLNELKRLQEIPNVRVLYPAVSSVDIVRDSKAVVVLAGTTGWEAFLQKKPVIAIGNTFYPYSDLVYRLTDMSRMSDVLWKALTEGARRYEEREEEWRWFIHAVLSTSEEGVTARFDPPYGFPDEEENARHIARAIAAKIQRLTTSDKTGRL